MDPRRWRGPRRIAHRGGGTLAPENTLAAIREGLARGYRAVEFDVMLTADDVPVLVHDPSFGRTIDGTGAVAATTWADLSVRDAGGWFDPRFAGEPVPRYDEVLAFCRAHGVWANVEIKPSPGADARTGRIVGEATVRICGDGVVDAAHGPLFSSFSVASLAAASAAAPGVPRAMLFVDVPLDAATVALGLGCVGVHADARSVDAATVARLHAAGLAVLAYTVDDRDRADALDAIGVDGLFVDRLDRLPFA